MSWSEDAVHRWLARRTKPAGLVGSRGHDAAVLAKLRGAPVVCADQVVEGVHFVADARPDLVGRKAACRALSDLAATAARPRALTCTIAVSQQRSESWIELVLTGVRSAARDFGADLVGGDLSSTRGPAVIGVTALGEFTSTKKPPGRNRARVGETVVLTGALGGSILGRHLRIEPRIDEGVWFADHGASALMDVSDGLAWDLFRLARAAKVAIELDLARVPVHRDARNLARTSGRAPLDHALHDGEDHELIATMSAAAIARARRGALAFTSIGRVVRGRGLVLVWADGTRERWTHARGGFEHGR